MLKMNKIFRSTKQYSVMALSMLIFSPYAMAAGNTSWLEILNQYA